VLDRKPAVKRCKLDACGYTGGMRSDEQSRTLDQVIGRNLRRLREDAGLSQDQVANRARTVGLSWTRSSVAAAEAGTKTFDVSELVLLVPLFGKSVDELLAGKGSVRVGSIHDLELPVVRGILAATVTASATKSTKAKVQPEPQRKRRPRRSATHVRRDVDENRGPRSEMMMDAIRPDPFEIEMAARGEAEQKAARRLGVEPLDLSIASFKRWHRSLTEERDARVDEQSDKSSTLRTIQARRGHITRQLLDELQPRLKKGR